MLAQNLKSVQLPLKKREPGLQIHCKVHTWYSSLLVWVVAQVLVQRAPHAVPPAHCLRVGDDGAILDDASVHVRRAE